jgi:T5SS/PEP-CTERM-associated repeat protein
VTVTGNSNSTISATLAGNGGLTKSGLGTLNLATALPTGSVRITGGTMQSSASVVGATANTRGNMTVSNAVWTNSGQLTVGGSGSGSLTVGSGGTVAASGLLIASNARSIGTVTIGDAGGVGSLTLGSGSISFGAGTGSLVFNQSGESTLSSTITSRSAGKGTITGSGTGTTTLSANNSGFSGTTRLLAGTVALGTNSRLGGTVNVANRNASVVLREGSTLTGTKVIHAVAGKLVDNTGLVFTNAIRGRVALSETGSLEKSYTANSSVAGFGAGIGAGKSFSLLSGSVTNSAILEAKITGAALDFKGTYSNNIVMAITDPSFSAIRNTIQWYDPVSQTWKNTVEGNTGNKTAALNGMNGKSFAGSFNTFLLQAGRGGILDAASDTLAEINALSAIQINTTLAKIMGAFGYDKSTKTSWAVINHNSLFSGRDLGYSSEYDAAALNHSLSGTAAASTIQTVPEPGTWALMIVGGIALLFATWRRRRS